MAEYTHQEFKNGMTLEAKHLISIEDAIIAAQSDIADLKYVPIDITNFTVSPAVVERGSTVSEATLSYTLNKAPSGLYLDGASQSTGGTSGSWTVKNIIADKTWALKAVDERASEDSANAMIHFYNGVYYGATADGATLNSASVLALTKSLQSGRAKTFTVTVGNTQRLTYACPESYGTPKFVIGGFEYAWTLAATINFTNACGYTEKYNIWRHGQTGGGSLTVVVS